MQYLLLGVAALLVVLLLVRGFTVANPQALARQLCIAAGVLALAGAGVMVVRGAAGPALGLAALGSWLIWGMGGVFGGGQAKPSGGQVSRITTEHLDVTLEHGSGKVSGRVLKGAFAGRELDSMKPVELALLWQDCSFADPQSAQILETFLDRTHPTWREDLARTEGPSRSPDGRMTRAEALEILGLEEGASEEDIRRAHRELMLKLHPDRGGSTYLATKINTAKDVLLGKRA